MTPSASAAAPRVGVVTVAYRSNDVLPEFLSSLDTALAEPRHLTIVDNLPSEDAIVRQLALDHMGTYLHLASNPGYGAAINAAVADFPESVAWIVVSNPDVVYRPDAIAELVRVCESDETIGASGPVVENADGTIYPSARSVPSLRVGIGHALFESVWPHNPWTAAYLGKHVVSDGLQVVGWLSGSCLVIRRSAFDEIGGFDEEYFMYFEDVDLGYRLAKAGYRNVFVPTARVLHTGGHSTRVESSRMVRIHHDSAKRFLAKRYAGWYFWPLRAILGVGLDARAAISVRRLSSGHPTKW